MNKGFLGTCVGLVDEVLAKLLVLLMASMVLVVSWQVASRYVWQSPSSVTEEMARFLLIWIGLLGAAYAYRTRMHLGLDLAVKQLSATGQHRCRQLGYGLGIVFAVNVLVVGGGHLMWITWQLAQMSAALAIPMAWVYSVIPLSGLFISFYGLCFLIDESLMLSTAKDPLADDSMLQGEG